jgi:phosphomannomutase
MLHDRRSATLNAEPIISVSGLRGIVGQSLTPDVAMRYACAFAKQLAEGPVILTRDGRASGRMLADAVRAALCAAGRHVVDADIAATPTTGVLIRSLQAAGGIQVSASHNPPEYNGLKLFGEDGRVISEAAGRPVLEAYRSGRWPTWVDHRRVGQLLPCGDTLGRHAQLVLATVDVAVIRKRRFRVLLDANHGAGSLLGQRLLDEMDCQLLLLGTPADGQFEHTPEPTEENLASICAAVRRSGVDVGFCQDPDADRLALIDESGRYVGEEFTLALAVQHVLGQIKGPIVTNCSSSRMSQDLAMQQGVPFFHSKVGEANVTALMLEKQAVFGGEGNGGPIDPRVGYVRDSFVGMALVLDAMAKSGKPLSRLAADLPQYTIQKTKIAVDPSRMAERFAQLERRFTDAQASRLDGLRLDWPDRWLLVRASNTEPIVRLIAEAKQREDAQRLCQQAAAVLE